MLVAGIKGRANMAAFLAFHNSWDKVTVYDKLMIHQLSQVNEIRFSEENRAIEVNSSGTKATDDCYIAAAVWAGITVRSLSLQDKDVK